MRNKKNRYGMLKKSGRRFRAERMNIFGVRVTTEFSIDDVRGYKYRKIVLHCTVVIA